LAKVAAPTIRRWNYMIKLPEPQTIVDSIGDGVVELAEGPVRAAINTADVAKNFATDVKANMDDFKKRMPADLSAVPDFAVRAATHTLKAGLDFVDGIGKAGVETFEAVRAQTKRIIG